MSDRYEEAIELATEAETFLSSRLARHIFDRAADVVDDCTKALTSVAPDNVTEIRRLQEEIRRQNTLAVWIQEILHAGLEAKQVLAGEEI